MRDQISKTIVFQFDNRFAKTGLLTIEMPYIPFRCLSGYYSKLYARAKKALAFGCDDSLVTGKHSFEERKTKRTVITLFNGLAIDFPYDASRKDLDIIEHHLQGLKMSAKE